MGAKVILVARNEDKLLKTFCELEGQGHCYYAFDIGRTNEIEELVKRIIGDIGPLDGLVYSAGMEAPIPLRQVKIEKLNEVFGVNLYGFLEVVRQVTKKGRYNDGMRIVGISSVAAQCGEKSRVVYSSSKAAMDSAIRCLAVELARKGICVNSVAPAMIETEMFERFAGKLVEGTETYKANRQYLGLGKPEDVANAIVFLLSPAARFITGVALPVDGGFTSC